MSLSGSNVLQGSYRCNRSNTLRGPCGTRFFFFGRSTQQMVCRIEQARQRARVWQRYRTFSCKCRPNLLQPPVLPPPRRPCLGIGCKSHPRGVTEARATPMRQLGPKATPSSKNGIDTHTPRQPKRNDFHPSYSYRATELPKITELHGSGYTGQLCVSRDVNKSRSLYAIFRRSTVHYGVADLLDDVHLILQLLGQGVPPAFIISEFLIGSPELHYAGVEIAVDQSQLVHLATRNKTSGLTAVLQQVRDMKRDTRTRASKCRDRERGVLHLPAERICCIRLTDMPIAERHGACQPVHSSSASMTCEYNLIYMLAYMHRRS